MLQQGRFVHKWSETFNQYFAIKYKLSEKAKNEIGNDVLKSLGFTVDAETISRHFFDFSNLKKMKKLMKTNLIVYCAKELKHI